MSWGGGGAGWPGPSPRHGRRAVGEDSAVCVGLDTHKAEIAVAVAEPGRSGEVRFRGEIANRPEAVRRLIERLAAVSTRSATGARVRLGRPGRGRQVLLGDLPGRAVAEAAARGVVEPVGEPAEVGPRERLGRALARQEATGAAVQVLDATFLPGAVRVAEVAGHAELAI